MKFQVQPHCICSLGAYSVKAAGFSLPARASLVYGPLDATAVDGPTNKPAVAPPLGGNDGEWIGPTPARVLRSLALDAWPVRSLGAFPGAPIARQFGNPPPEGPGRTHPPTPPRLAPTTPLVLRFLLLGVLLYSWA